MLVGSLSCSAGSAECQSCGIASGQVGLVQAQGAPFLGSAEPDEAAEGSQCGMMEWLGSLGISQEEPGAGKAGTCGNSHRDEGIPVMLAAQPTGLLASNQALNPAKGHSGQENGAH